jgi:hypothetical protein
MRYDIACINAIRGDKAEALRWLQTAIDFGWREYHSALRNPMLESIHGDEQFKQMMVQVQARIEEMRTSSDEIEK